MLRNATATAALCLFALGCMPEPTTDDNGNPSWVQQVVPELLGRKSRGWEETDVLAKAAGLLGRTTVTRAVALDPDFAANWSEILVDHLQIQRADLVAANRTADTQCWGGPMAFEEGEGDGFATVGARGYAICVRSISEELGAKKNGQKHRSLKKISKKSERTIRPHERSSGKQVLLQNLTCFLGIV